MNMESSRKLEELERKVVKLQKDIDRILSVSQVPESSSLENVIIAINKITKKVKRR